MLAKNIASLEAQTDPDYEQLFIVDDEGQGIGWANRSLIMVEPVGDYVMVLDDDDMLENPQAIELMKEATIDRPAMLIFKAKHDGLGILPSPAIWGKRPLKGHIGSCDFISRRDVWEKHINRFGVDEGGDYAYLHAVWMDRPEVVWLDEVLASVQRISHGAPA
jgi:glycosyltransferase involved in cell wall biosynthesis